jgi:hypothetical protein
MMVTSPGVKSPRGSQRPTSRMAGSTRAGYRSTRLTLRITSPLRGVRRDVVGKARMGNGGDRMNLSTDVQSFQMDRAGGGGRMGISGDRHALPRPLIPEKA